jgi:hypothetical protein
MPAQVIKISGARQHNLKNYFVIAVSESKRVRLRPRREVLGEIIADNQGWLGLPLRRYGTVPKLTLY